MPVTPDAPHAAIARRLGGGRHASARHVRAWADLRAAAGLWRLCLALAWHDLRLRYHGSVLGPFWLTLSSGLTILALGGLYAHLLAVPSADYVPYLAVSLLLWNALAGLLADGCTLFTQQAPTIRSLRMPYGVYAARLLLRALFSTAHAALVLVPVFIIYAIAPRLVWLLLIPAVALWLITGFFAALALGALCARFRDIPPAVASALQLGFFVTPVLWRAELLGLHAPWLALNPFHPMLEILRAPLLGQAPAPGSWLAALVVSALVCAIGWLIFARTRARLAVWV